MIVELENSYKKHVCIFLIHREYEEIFTVFFLQIILYSYLFTYSSIHVKRLLRNDNRFQMISVNHDDDSLSWNWVSYKYIYIYIYIYLKKLITFNLFKNIMTHHDLYKESMCPVLYQLSLVRIHFIYFWIVQSHLKTRKIWMIIFYHFLSIRRLKMTLHRDFMIPIMNFYRIRDLHRDFRSISELLGEKKNLISSFDFPTYFVLQTHDIVFSSRQSDLSHYVNDQDIIKRRMMKVKSFSLYTFTSRSFKNLRYFKKSI